MVRGGLAAAFQPHAKGGSWHNVRVWNHGTCLWHAVAKMLLSQAGAAVGEGQAALLGWSEFAVRWHQKLLSYKVVGGDCLLW